MKIFLYVVGGLLAYSVFMIYRKLKSRYDFGFYYINKEEEQAMYEEIDSLIQQAEEAESKKLDLRGTPTHECVCGSKVWRIHATFTDYEVGSYFLDMECAECGTYATAPTPLDRERME
jgi:hypothetical protein